MKSKEKGSVISVPIIGSMITTRLLPRNSVMGTTDFRRSKLGECCLNCEERHLACHDTCAKYQTALTEWKAYKDMLYNARKLNEYDQHKIHSIQKIKRRRYRDDGRS